LYLRHYIRLPDTSWLVADAFISFFAVCAADAVAFKDRCRYIFIISILILIAFITLYY
jgi:hypothetical protein